MVNLKAVQANTVILASSFNPSVATKDWLRDRIVHEEPTTFVNTPLVSVFETPALHILVDQSHFQATCKDTSEETLNRCAEIAEVYVRTLPHTPYEAIGFNYVWEVAAADGDPGRAEPQSRCVCALPGLTHEFEAYSVQPVLVGRTGDCRVRAAVEPSLGDGRPVVVSINYHYDYADTERVAAAAGRLTGHMRDSERLARLLFEENDG